MEVKEYKGNETVQSKESFGSQKVQLGEQINIRYRTRATRNKELSLMDTIVEMTIAVIIDTNFISLARRIHNCMLDFNSIYSNLPSGQLCRLT